MRGTAGLDAYLHRGVNSRSAGQAPARPPGVPAAGGTLLPEGPAQTGSGCAPPARRRPPERLRPPPAPAPEQLRRRSRSFATPFQPRALNTHTPSGTSLNLPASPQRGGSRSAAHLTAPLEGGVLDSRVPDVSAAVASVQRHLQRYNARADPAPAGTRQDAPPGCCSAAPGGIGDARATRWVAAARWGAAETCTPCIV